MSKFLLLKPEFQKDIKVFYEKTKKKPDALEEIRLMKNYLNKKAKQTDATNEEEKKALETIRLYNHMKKLQTEKDTEKQMREEEKLYRKDFRSSARNVTNGTFGTQSSQPTFEKSTADEYYKNKYENATIIDYDELKWFPKVDKPSVSYNLSPYRPKDIKHALYKKSNNSAPGEDDIVYHYLKTCTMC